MERPRPYECHGHSPAVGPRLCRSSPSGRRPSGGSVSARKQRRRWKSICSALDPALPINEIASFHLFFSFRPSWSSSTPAYGTLLPWGRTMRKPSPVSPFSPIYFPSAFLCRFRHSAKDSVSLSLQIEIPVGHFVLQKEGYSSFH